MITMMTTKDDDKGDEQKAQVNQRTSQENQEQVKSSRIKNNSRLKKKAYKQESRFKIQDLKNQDQDSRMKKRLNQDKY